VTTMTQLQIQRPGDGDPAPGMITVTRLLARGW